jgi:F420-0:gamma-glutamyl ligase
MFTITKNSLMLSAGIDESNSDGNFVLWPKNPLQTAKSIHYLITQKLNIRDFGVIIADSTSKPFRLGTTGLSLAHWGFKELNNYIGNNDLFGRTITVSKANVAEGIASAGVLVMGEGSEQTPLALATQLDFVKFNNKYGGTCYNNAPNSYTKDLYEPFWKAVKWNKGEDN